MATPPKWAQFKVRMYFATCWMCEEEDGTILMEGVNWINDKLLSFCSWFHNYFVAPFLPDEENNGFPIRILEAYDIDKAHELLEQGRLR